MRMSGIASRLVVLIVLLIAFSGCTRAGGGPAPSAGGSPCTAVPQQEAGAGGAGGRQYFPAPDFVRKGYEALQRILSFPAVLAQERTGVTPPLEKFPVVISLVQGRAECRIDGAAAGKAPFKGELAYGEHTIVFSAPGAPDMTARVFIRRPETLRFRLQADKLPIASLGVYACGSQPKQVIFSPDDRFIYIPLLNDVGFQIFDFEKREMISTVSVGPKPKRKGFPEGLFIEKHSAFFISQMSTNCLFEYAYGGDGVVRYRRMFPSQGVFPKFIAYAPSLDFVAVSNWSSSDVAVFDYETARTVKKIPGLKTPRGLAFSPDGRRLYIASFDGGDVIVYDTSEWKERKRFHRAGSAMRHLALDPERNRLFVSDMGGSFVFELDMDSLSLLHSYKTAPLPNTIALDSAGLFLFVSCRGPNDPEDYTRRSPRDSVVNVFDTRKKVLVGSIRGGNQPTGLDISSDDRFLAFSNFQDANFELYDISGLYAGNGATGDSH